MKLLTFQRRSGSPRAGILISGNRVLDLSLAYSRRVEGPSQATDTAGIIESLQGLSASWLEILRAGDDALSSCYELEREAERGQLDELLFPLGDTPLLSPIIHPPLLLHFDAHEKHVKATQEKLGIGTGELPEAWYLYPIHHLGNSHNIIGPSASVIFPQGEQEMDFELEFAAVLGEDVRDASIDDAEDAILGYTIVNDWTARMLQRDLQRAGLGPSKAKTFCSALGPWIVTKDEIANPYDLLMKARINGEELATGRTGEARFTFPEMISYASEGTLLPAGTVLTSGAVAGGSGIEIGRLLQPGDHVELEIEGIGVLSNYVYDRQQEPIFTPKR